MNTLSLLVAMIGLVLHLMMKIGNGKKHPRFSWKIFWKKNWHSYLITIIGLTALSMTELFEYRILAFTIGYGGASFFKNIMKYALSKVKDVIDGIFNVSSYIGIVDYQEYVEEEVEKTMKP